MSAKSISLRSFRLLTTRIPHSLHYKHPIFKIIFLQIPTTSSSFFKPILQIPTTSSSFFKPISFEGVLTIPSVTASSTASTSSSVQPIEELPQKVREIVKLFQSVREPKVKYEQLMFYGTNLKPLNAQFKFRENKVEGCVSQVWVRAFLDQDKNVVYEADSDSVLTKGLAALLVQGLSGRPVEEVMPVSKDFIVLLGLQQSLTPSRNNGFLNMLKLMKKKALMLYAEAENCDELNPNPKSELKIENSNTGQSSEIDNAGKKPWASTLD